MDIITSAQALNLVQDAGTVPPGMLAALVTGVSEQITNYCRRSFYAKRFMDYYDGSSQGYLYLRNAPLVLLNSVTRWPSSPNPTVYTASQFQIRYKEGRINFMPNVVGTFFDRFDTEISFPTSGLNSTMVDSFAGFGWATSLTATVASGANVPLPLAAIQGITPEMGVWQAQAAGTIMLDELQATEEEVAVTWNGSQLVATNLIFPHSVGALVGGPLAPSDLTMAAALMVGGYIHAQDLSKAGEQQGRLGGYVWTGRDGDYVMTPEILRVLNYYRDTTA